MIRKSLRLFFKKIGYDFKLSKKSLSEINDVRGLYKDPRVFNYLGKKPILIDIPLAKTRRLQTFLLSHKIDPFALSVWVAAKRGGDKKKQISKILELYYNTVQPNNALEWIGLVPEDAKLLEDQKPWVTPTPWTNISIDSFNQGIIKSTERENYKWNKNNIDISEGFLSFGPVSTNKLIIEGNRLESILNSIQNNGYNRSNENDGDIHTSIFVNETGEWTARISAGQHRAAILAGLEYSTIPVRVTNIIYRCDVDAWPNVINGFYSRDGALKYFDNIFSGVVSPAAKEWEKLAMEIVNNFHSEKTVDL